MAQRPHVAILGAGFGGLETVKTLSRAPVEISVIDRQNYHCFQPLLYQVATAALSPAEVAWPIRHILRRQQNVTVFMTEVDGVDAPARIVKSKAGPFAFDFLVIATGATHSYFGHDEWAVFAPGSSGSKTRPAFAAASCRRSRKLSLPAMNANATNCSHSLSSAAALLESKWPALSLKLRGRHWPGTFAASIRAAHELC